MLCKLPRGQEVPRRRHIIQGHGNAGTHYIHGVEGPIAKQFICVWPRGSEAQEATMFSSDHKTHLFTYRHGGAEWTLEIKARDIHDAKERLKALPLARYDGELITKVPTNLGPLMQLAVWLRNVLRPA